METLHVWKAFWGTKQTIKKYMLSLVVHSFFGHELAFTSSWHAEIMMILINNVFDWPPKLSPHCKT